MTTAQELLPLLAASVPDGVNPYIFLAAALHDQIYSSDAPSFDPQIYTMTGFLLLRRVTSQGTFLTPNASTVFLVFNSIYIILSVPYSFWGLRFASGRSSLHGLILWKTLVFLPLWFATWSSAWAICLQGLLRQAPLLDNHRPRAHAHAHFRDRDGSLVSAKVLNTFFLGAAALVVASVVPLECISSVAWDTGFSEYEGLEKALLDRAEGWKGEAVQLDAGVVQVVQAMLDHFQVALHWFRIGWAVWAFWGMVLVATLLPSTAFYCRTLRLQMNSITTSFSCAGTDGSDVENLHVGALVDRAQSRSLEKTFTNLLINSIAQVTLVSIYTAIAIWTAVRATENLKSPELLRLSYLLALYPYVTFVGVAVILLFLRSLSTPSSTQNRSSMSPFASQHKPSLSSSFSEVLKWSSEKKQSRKGSTVSAVFADQTIVVSMASGEHDDEQIELPKMLEEVHLPNELKRSSSTLYESPERPFQFQS